MQPLEGFYYFTHVVDHGGFARAARVLGIPRSRVSRHVVALEAALNVRLVNRSTRRFVVTDVGHEVYRHATAMLAEADAALEAVEFARAAPRGTIKVSCPVALAQNSLAALLPDFLVKLPAVRLQLHVSNRRVDVLSEGFDVALRVRSRPTGEDGLVMRSFGEFTELLVASPAYLARAGEPTEPAQLTQHETLDYAVEFDRRPWDLVGPDGQAVQVQHRPRVCCHDFVVLRAAVLAGLGLARLPEAVVREDLHRGALVRVLPAWSSPQGVLHVVFPSRRGLLPAVRAFIDFLAERLPGTM
ncbi:MAG: LysR family transcriptional regulator [Steroidobacteraceae bacterium]